MKSRVGQVWEFIDLGEQNNIIIVVIKTNFSRTLGPMAQPVAEHRVVHLTDFSEDDSEEWDEYQDDNWDHMPEMKRIV